MIACLSIPGFDLRAALRSRPAVALQPAALAAAGFSVDPAAAGVAYFDTRGVERLYGGLEPALKRALAAAGAQWDARVGAAGRRFAALAAASVSKPGQILVVRDDE